MAVTTEMRTEVSQLYVALFGRAPDSEGLGFWTQMLADGASVSSVADTMYATDPARSYYPLWMTNQEIVASFYLNVLGRPADAEGLAYWTAKMNAPGATPGSVITQIIDVVTHYTGTDPAGLVSAALFANKAEVAEYYAEHGGSIAGATAVLVGVTDDPATVDAAIAALSGPTIGETFTLTTGVDTIVIATPNTADTIKGIVDGDAIDGNGSTFTPTDSIQGNGFTTLQLVVTDTGDAAFATLNDIKTIDVVAGVGGWADFNAVDWHDIGGIQLNAGANGMSAYFSNLHAGVDLSVGSAVSGSLTVDYTDGHGAWVFSDKGASISYIDGGNITAAAGAGDDVSAEVWANAGGVNLVVGDVSFAGAAADSAFFSAWAGDNTGADITIGNVSMAGFNEIDFEIWNTDHTAASPASNVTIGDVTLSVGKSGSISASISNSGDGVVGNTTIGNITLTAGDNATSAYFDQYQWGELGAGDVTVGDISVLAGLSASDADVYIENYAGWHGGAAVAPIAQGDLTVGNVSYDLAMNATGYFSASAQAYTSAAGIALSVGDFTVGDFSANLGQDAYLSIWMNDEADANAGAATLGNVSIGNMSFDLAVDASLSLSVSVSADAGGAAAATIGNVQIGDLDLNMGINSYASISYSITAYGTNPALVSIGDVSVGDVNVVADDGASLEYSFEVTSYGDLGNVSLGSLSVVAGVSADISISYEISASNDMGNVTIGNIDLTAGQNADVSASYSISAWNGAVGDVTIGDVSVAATVSGWASLWAGVSGETAVGNMTVGDVSISALGLNASASVGFTFENDGVGTLGDLTVGNVDMVVNGDSAYGQLYISASSAASGGTITVGDLDLTVGTLAKKTALLEVTIDNDLGNVVVGDITVNAASVRGVGDVTMAYDADVSILSVGNISVGVVSVSGGGTLADPFANLTWLAMTNGGGAHTTTIGGVDYSAYGAAATLDVSGFLGAATIKGSAFGDTITDNKGANTITSGGGADTVTFLDTNTGKTLGAMDQLLGFNDAGGDKIDLSVAVSVVNYGEASYADFATFVTGANAADKAVYVGLVGSDAFAAVDYNTDGVVDFMIELVGLGSLGNVDVASFV